MNQPTLDTFAVCANHRLGLVLCGMPLLGCNETLPFQIKHFMNTATLTSVLASNQGCFASATAEISSRDERSVVVLVMKAALGSYHLFRQNFPAKRSSSPVLGDQGLRGMR